jgi:hypothetical protein
MSEAERHRHRAARTEAELARAVAQLQGLQAAMLAAQAEAEHLRAEAGDGAQQRGGPRPASAAASTATAATAAAARRVDDLEGALMDARIRLAAAEAVEAEAESLRARVASLEAGAAEAHAAARRAEAEGREARGQAGAAAAQLEAVLQRAEAAEARLALEQPASPSLSESSGASLSPFSSAGGQGSPRHPQVEGAAATWRSNPAWSPGAGGEDAGSVGHGGAIAPHPAHNRQHRVAGRTNAAQPRRRQPLASGHAAHVEAFAAELRAQLEGALAEAASQRGALLALVAERDALSSQLAQAGARLEAEARRLAAQGPGGQQQHQELRLQELLEENSGLVERLGAMHGKLRQARSRAAQLEAEAQADAARGVADAEGGAHGRHAPGHHRALRAQGEDDGWAEPGGELDTPVAAAAALVERRLRAAQAEAAALRVRPPGSLAPHEHVLE